MKKNLYYSKGIVLFVLWAAFTLSPATGKSQSENATKSKGSLAESAWQKGEANWRASMLQSFALDETSLNEFLNFNAADYIKDRGEFFEGFKNGLITEDNAEAFFHNLEHKYFDLYKTDNGNYTVENRGGADSASTMAACNPSCFNINFQAKTLNGWTTCYGVAGSSSAAANITGKTCGNAGSVTQAGGPNPNTGNSYHVSLLTAPGSDPIAGPLIPYTPPLGGLAVRVGDGPNYNYGAGIIEQTYMVDISAPILTVQYAVVFENPAGHNGFQQPWFKMEVLDANGTPIAGCGQYFVVSGPGLPGFKTFTYQGETVYARPWTTAFVPLYNYIGQCVTVRWTASDCALGGHFGYAYVSATCAKLDLTSSIKVFCLNQKSGTITGPPGAAAYQWSTIGGCIQGSSTTQAITITCGGTYTLVTQSSAGAQCTDTFSTVIPNVTSGPPPTPHFSATRVCAGTPTTFNGTNTVPLAGTKFYWDFYGSGTYNDSSGANPIWTYTVGGTYAVRMHITTTNGCEADTTINVIVDAPNVNTLPTWTSTFTNATACGSCNGKFSMTVTGGSIRDTIKTSFDNTYLLIGGGSPPVSVGGTKNCGAIWNANGSYTLSFCNLCPGAYKMYVVPLAATAPSNCTPGGFYGDTIPFAITAAGLAITANINSIPATCGQNNGAISLTGLGGTGPYTFTWTNPVLPAGPTQTGLAPGNYDVIIRDVNGCQGNTTVNIGNLAQLSAQVSPVDVSCFGANDGIIKITPTAGNGPFTYSWSPIPNTTDSAGGLAAGSYTIYLTDVQGCTGTLNATINQPTEVKVAITASVLNVLCGQTGSATAAGSGGYFPYTYKWSNGGYTASVTGLAAGPYTVTATDGLGCTATIPILVTISNGPQADAGLPAAICFGAGTSAALAGSTTGGVTYTWSPAPVGGCASCLSTTTSPTTTTTYVLTVTDASSCSSFDTVTVTVNPLPPVTISPPSAICTGNNVTLTSGGATAYLWSNGQSGIGLNSITVTPPVGPNPYTVTGIDNNGCINVANTTVTINPVPVVTITPPVSICAGGTVTITSSGGSAYSWSTGQTTIGVLSSINVTPSSTSTYSVTAVDINGCVNANSTTVTVNPLATVPISPPLSLCPGSSTQLTAGGGVIYLWSTGETTSAITVTPTMQTTYSVDVTDANGCKGNNTVTVGINPQLTVNMSPDVSICIGSSTQITAIPPVGSVCTYTWTPGIAGGLNDPTSQTPTASPTITTTYSVEVNDANGCQGSNLVTVTVNQLPVITANNPAAVCLGTGVQLSATGGSAYVWNATQTGASITVTPPVGTTGYTVVGTDGNGCVSSDTTSVNVNPLPIILISLPSSICVGGSSTITASGGLGYAWSNGTSGIGLNTITVTPPVGPNTYSVMGVDMNGCINSNTTSVLVNALPVVNISAPASICIGASAVISASGGTTYVWSTGQSVASFTDTPPLGLSTYSVTVTDINGCVENSNTSVTVNPLPVITASLPVTICFGDVTQLSASGGIGFSWSDNQVGSPINVSPPVGTTNYTVTGIDINGCINTDFTSVVVNPLPVINVSPDPSICKSSSASISASGAVSYSWTVAAGLSSDIVPDPDASPSVTTTYTVVGTDAAGCKGINYVTVNVEQPPTALTSPVDICVGQTAQLTASGGSFFTWTPSLYLDDTTIYNPVSTPLNTITYTVEVSNGALCPPAYASATVTVKPIPTIKASGDTSIIAGTSAQLTSTGNGIGYTWTPSLGLDCPTCSSPLASPLFTTQYIVTTFDQYGCVNSDTILINVDDILTLYVPTAFVPNFYNPNNNVFYAYGVGIWEFEFYIFDRWGTLVFKTTDPTQGWDGTYKGNMVPSDVYVWLAKAVSITGKSISKTGPVTVVR